MGEATWLGPLQTRQGMSYNTELALIPKKYAEIKSLIRISQSVQRDTA